MPLSFLGPLAIDWIGPHLSWLSVQVVWFWEPASPSEFWLHLVSCKSPSWLHYYADSTLTTLVRSYPMLCYCISVVCRWHTGISALPSPFCDWGRSHHATGRGDPCRLNDVVSRSSTWRLGNHEDIDLVLKKICTALGGLFVREYQKSWKPVHWEGVPRKTLLTMAREKKSGAYYFWPVSNVPSKLCTCARAHWSWDERTQENLERTQNFLSKMVLHMFHAHCPIYSASW